MRMSCTRGVDRKPQRVGFVRSCEQPNAQPVTQQNANRAVANVFYCSLRFLNNRIAQGGEVKR